MQSTYCGWGIPSLDWLCWTQTTFENNHGPKSLVEGEMTTNNQWICNKENGSMGTSNCSLHGAHNFGVASYVPHHDNYAIFSKNYAISPMDTQQTGG
jgi:hypothetical protein